MWHLNGCKPLRAKSVILSKRLIFLSLLLILVRPVRLTKEETINVLETNMASQMLHLANDFLQVKNMENRHEPQPVSFCLLSSFCCYIGSIYDTHWVEIIFIVLVN